MDDEEMMRAMGLPTSFNGKSNRVTKRKRNSNQNHNQETNKKIVFEEYNEEENENQKESGELEDNKEHQENQEYEGNHQYNQNEGYQQGFEENNQNEDDFVVNKFWDRRYHLFSLFDQGIKMDTESWFSVTPEKIAKKIAERYKDKIVLDAFCGPGGNTIQFAKVCKKVYAVEINKERIEICKNNAKVYGVYDKIEFINGDYVELASSKFFEDKNIDAVFLAPPWGGLGYTEYDCFFLNMLPIDGYKIFELAQKLTPNIGYCLPKNTNAKDLLLLAGEDGICEVNLSKIRNKPCLLTAFYGDLAKEIIY